MREKILGLLQSEGEAMVWRGAAKGGTYLSKCRKTGSGSKRLPGGGVFEVEELICSKKPGRKELRRESDGRGINSSMPGKGGRAEEKRTYRKGKDLGSRKHF